MNPKNFNTPKGARALLGSTHVYCSHKCKSWGRGEPGLKTYRFLRAVNKFHLFQKKRPLSKKLRPSKELEDLLSRKKILLGFQFAKPPKGSLFHPLGYHLEVIFTLWDKIYPTKDKMK